MICIVKSDASSSASDLQSKGIKTMDKNVQRKIQKGGTNYNSKDTMTL